ncbi:hypothetical protein [Curtobacterium sp. MCBD17_019]|uniref:hypothetical protein n=1 Tax=Curtobacterium sp. MCBD17_019 TaxID=2175669 RepID=UPI000DA9FC31|nr:hypothetical protein [Curtobacterium sp. MCBD17_019]PZE75337.1 hypothetical protein DEI82_08320 [Curtobacterium sp. MCBD17_019]
MFDFDKLFIKLYVCFAAILASAIALYLTVRIIEAIWWQLLICLAALALLAGLVFFLWARFRRW